VIAVLLPLLGSPLVWYGLIAAGLTAAFAWWSLRQRSQGAAAERAKQEAAAAAEHKRRMTGITAARLNAEREAAGIAERDGKRNEQVAEIDRESAGYIEPAFTAGDVEFLRRAGC